MDRTLEPEVMDTAEEADSYDAMDHGEPNEAFVSRLVELGAAGPMLDIGSGPGHIPLVVCERVLGSRVIGIDMALHMLAYAERHRLASAHRDRIAYLVTDASQLGFADGSFDTVYSNTILHHIPDPRPFLREAHRVLSEHGTLLIRDLMRPESPERASELVELHAAGEDEAQQELLRASLHAALTPGELRAMADEVGLSHAEVVIDTDRHMSLQIRRGI